MLAADAERTTAPIPFAVPDISEAEIQAVVDVMKSGWLTSGKLMRAFEQAVAAWLSPTSGTPPESVAVNSATAGLHLALLGLGIGPGDEVIVPTMTFAATAEVVHAVGARPMLCDVCPDTCNIRLADLEATLSDRTRAIIIVHFAGAVTAEMAAILVWAKRKGLRIIEDAAHAFGAECGGVRIGALPSDCTVFSFYATKCITTGEGGMLVTRDDGLAARARKLRLHGIDRDVFDRYTGAASTWEYDVVAPGWKYNLTDIAAAIGIEQLRREHPMWSRRVAIACSYDRLLHRRLRRPAAPDPPRRDHAWHLYPIRVPDRRDRFINALHDRGIGASVHFKPLHRTTAYACDAQRFPGAEAYWPKALSLPLYSSMTESQVARVIETVNEVATDYYGD